MQFAPGAVWVTSLCLTEGVYGGLLEPVVAAFLPAAASAIDVLTAQILDHGARLVAVATADAGRILAEPGYEIADPAGEIIAEAELAWPAQTVCVMTAAQMEFADAARGLGWTVFEAATLTEEVQPLIALLPSRESP